MTHDHSHLGGPLPPAPARTRRNLAIAVVPFVIATLVGLIVLWPSDPKIDPAAAPDETQRFAATVISVEPDPCELPGQEEFECVIAEVRLDSGPDVGDTAELSMTEGPNVRHISVGDKVLIGQVAGSPDYFFLDYERGRSLLVLAVIFAVVVIALSRLRGVAALLGTGVSLVVLITFILPAILEGKSPLAVAIVGGATVMFLALYLAHGINVRTTTAVLGTFASLAITGTLALIFVRASRFSGFSSEEAVFLQISAQQVNLEGLILGGIIIGTLGVLDDVTITQASAVWELHVANPTYRAIDLYRSALRVGRAHVASAVNTLVLAYAGAALPLLILFSLSDRGLGEILTGEIIAEEIVRTLVGSIGLVASVPITTGLAAYVASRSNGVPKKPSGFKRPRAEAEWRSESDLDWPKDPDRGGEAS